MNSDRSNNLSLKYPRCKYQVAKIYSETINNEYIERIHQMSYSSLSDNEMLQIFSFLNDYMELFKTVPAYSWLFIYFRKD